MGFLSKLFESSGESQTRNNRKLLTILEDALTKHTTEKRQQEVNQQRRAESLRKGNEFYFQIYVTDEQKKYAIELVDYSIAHHPVTDIFANDPDGKKRQREFRYTGSLGEVVFADAYGLPRPKRSFGAVDGQDFGQDFQLTVNGISESIDVKTMHRKNNSFKANYVLNLPSYQVHKSMSLTDNYFCISLHENAQGVTVATFIGFVSKKAVTDGLTGDLFKAGTKRIKEDNTYFTFMRDTYEVMFKDIASPLLTDTIRNLPGFKLMHLAPGYRENNRY